MCCGWYCWRGWPCCRPCGKYHKQLILLAFGVLQLGEGWLVDALCRSAARPIVVLLKIALATLLIDHTGELAINSYYYPIYYLPVVTAAEYFGPWATLLWTSLASAAYCSYLYPALQEYRNHAGGLRTAGDPHCSSSFSRPWW